MVEFIECYSEYLKFEEALRFAIRILNLSFIRFNVLCGFEKYILLTFQLYCLSSAVFTMIFYERNIMKCLLSVISALGCCQILTKTFSIVTHPEELDFIFKYFQGVHQVHKLDSITNSARVHLKRILFIAKLILK